MLVATVPSFAVHAADAPPVGQRVAPFFDGFYENADGSVTVACDPLRIGQVLTNLVMLPVVLFVFSPILMFTIPNEIEKMYQRDGQRSPISTVWGRAGWTCVVVGGLPVRNSY